VTSGPRPALAAAPLPERTDVLVIGAGIVGLATAWQLQQERPGTHVTVVDKEPELAAHQTGRNSGVIHSGIYYAPGSAKARLCREGRSRLLDFCAAHGIAHEVCGKVIVARDPADLAALAALEDRAARNAIAVERLDGRRLREREPHVAGEAALLVHDAGIVDFVGVSATLVRLVTEAGGVVVGATTVRSAVETGAEVIVETDRGPVRAGAVANCAGLFSDRVAAAAGAPGPVRIMPFRGEYFELRPERRHLVRHLVYPVPDARFPFLGVHLTRMVGGSVHAGPNAVIALAREGYRWRDVVPGDVWELASASSSWRLARRYWRIGLGELHRSVSRAAFVRALQRLVPELVVDDLVASPAGVRAQAIDADGSLLDDFAWRETPRVVHVVNAPSPAATASLAVGAEIAGRVTARLQ
jgi:(S)-2-hydroxyglutarate dehydrogenase